MVDVGALLGKRFRSNNNKKMNELAKQSSNGQLSSFSGVFRISPLSISEKELITSILKNFNETDRDIEKDLEDLINLSSEVKAINNQAIILHGERIKRAQEILKNYREGAFTAWLIATYGNRQTPYNFLQYYELNRSLPEFLQEKLNEMPRQAVYTLASREGPRDEKEAIIKNYNGESKQAILERIRKVFPLREDDKRRQNLASITISSLNYLLTRLKEGIFQPSEKEKKRIEHLLHELTHFIESKVKI